MALGTEGSKVCCVPDMALTPVPLEILCWVDDVISLAQVHMILKEDRNTRSLGWVRVLTLVGKPSSDREQYSLPSHMTHSTWDPHLV